MDMIALIKWGLNLFELLACITGFLYWNKIQRTYWKWFPVYLAIIVVTELAGKYLLYDLSRPDLNGNLYLYFGIPLQFLFFFWLFGQYYSRSGMKRLPLVGACCYVLCWILDIIYFNETSTTWWFRSFSYTVGNVILLLLIIGFFSRIIRSDEILQIKSNLMFWVCVGLLTFYLGTLPFFGLYNTLNEKHPHIFDVYWYIQIGLDYLMYLFFMAGFIWGKPR